MSVTVTCDYISDLFGACFYGKKLLDLPRNIIDGIDAYYDGSDLDNFRLVIDSLVLDMRELSDVDVVFEQSFSLPNVLSIEDVDDPEIFAKEYVNNNYDVVFNALSEDFNVFGRYNGIWYVA